MLYDIISHSPNGKKSFNSICDTIVVNNYLNPSQNEINQTIFKIRELTSTHFEIQNLLIYLHDNPEYTRHLVQLTSIADKYKSYIGSDYLSIRDLLKCYLTKSNHDITNQIFKDFHKSLVIKLIFNGQGYVW